ELVELSPDIIVGYGTPVVVALQQETRSIPIVFLSVTDPVGQGLVASLAHPGGNIDATASGHRDGAARPGLQHDARHDHHRRPTATGSDESIAANMPPLLLQRRPRPDGESGPFPARNPAIVEARSVHCTRPSVLTRPRPN